MTAVAIMSYAERWMEWWKDDHSPEGLAVQLDDNVVMFSPVVHTPQQGKSIAMAYLLAAGVVIGTDDFTYKQVFDCGCRAVLEFETKIDGLYVNGVDMIEWNGEGKITEFKVMIRPLKAIHIVHEQMGAALMRLQS